MHCYCSHDAIAKLKSFWGFESELQTKNAISLRFAVGRYVNAA